MESQALLYIVLLTLMKCINFMYCEYTQETNTILGNDISKTFIVRHRRGNVLNHGKVKNQVIYNIDQPEFGKDIFRINSIGNNMGSISIGRNKHKE